MQMKFIERIGLVWGRSIKIFRGRFV
jgi:hypothetical protein